ncbi:MAG: hypothetical protein PHP01_08400 [Phycisphaerae bacterium]|nr:hypothetical protein [Phycisphaerae bacterium]
MKNYFHNKGINLKKTSFNKKTIISLTLAILIVLCILWFVGIFMTPKNFRVVNPINSELVSPYLTNYILPHLYNKSQYDQPFDFEISQDGINDIIARHTDSNGLEKAGLSDLSVSFRPGRILLTGKTHYHGFDFIVTMVLKPRIDRKGQFSLNGSKFRLGDSPMPFIARAVEEKIANRLEQYFKDSKNAGFIKSLLDSGKVTPAFKINNSKLRVEKIIALDKKLIIHFLPQQDG